MKVDADYWKGFWAGRAIAVRLSALGKEVSDWYLYNGVRLPKLPVVEGYPYALVSQQNVDIADSNYYFVDYSDEKFYIGGYLNGFVKSDGNGHRYRLLIDGGTEWEYLFETDSYSEPFFKRYIWASHDVLAPDGTVRIAASEPVPTT